MRDLGKLIVAKGFKSCLKCKKSPNLVTLFTVKMGDHYGNHRYLVQNNVPISFIFPSRQREIMDKDHKLSMVIDFDTTATSINCHSDVQDYTRWLLLFSTGQVGKATNYPQEWFITTICVSLDASGNTHSIRRSSNIQL